MISLGDEMRVTVIATGIGKEKEMIRATGQTTASRKNQRHYTGGSGENYRLRRAHIHPAKKGCGRIIQSVYRGTGGSIINDSDLDVPTFLRRKAD